MVVLSQWVPRVNSINISEPLSEESLALKSSLRTSEVKVRVQRQMDRINDIPVPLPNMDAEMFVPVVRDDNTEGSHLSALVMVDVAHTNTLPHSGRLSNGNLEFVSPLGDLFVEP